MNAWEVHLWVVCLQDCPIVHQFLPQALGDGTILITKMILSLVNGYHLLYMLGSPQILGECINVGKLTDCKHAPVGNNHDK